MPSIVVHVDVPDAAATLIAATRVDDNLARAVEAWWRENFEAYLATLR